ncbi:MAG: DeoR/GlpR transcriptional regulator [Anaerolineaceae bacterium]|nr:DeoR/GlpR transcriptional regulator [Anaerolineaceae bacterium]
MLKTERQKQILSKLTPNAPVEVSELSEVLNVSEATIRRDLDELSNNGVLKRIHGGATLLVPGTVEPPVVQRQQQQPAEKEAIARYAIAHIQDGNTIALEAGSTTLALAKQIASCPWNNLSVVTNSVPILNTLIPVAGVHIMFVGGVINSNELCSNWNPSDDVLNHIHTDTFFCGCRALHHVFGRSNEMLPGIDEIRTVQAFAAASDSVVALVDHTKFNKIFSLQLLQMTQINLLITSELAEKRFIDQMQQVGVMVEIAPMP